MTARRKRTAGRPKASAQGARLRAIYARLYAANGKQHWWPGDTPFEIMVGAVLTQNTAWVNVVRAIENLRNAGALSPRAIMQSHSRRLATWLRPSGYFNVKTKRLKALCEWLLEQGSVKALSRQPTEALRTALLAVHGVGPETADDILLYAFGRPVFVVDAYTRRIFSRLGVLNGDEDYETVRTLFEKRLGPDSALYNEFHALIVMHGKGVCRPRPRCGACVLAERCQRRGVTHPLARAK